MNYKLVPKQLTDSMAKVLRNEHCVYQTEQELYDAMLEAAPAAPVELEPMAYMASSGTCITAEDVSYTPNWTDYYTTPLVRQSDAAAVIAKLTQELETERMRLAACGVVAMANTPESAVEAREMHPDYMSASCQDVMRAVDAEMKYREQLAAADEDAARYRAR